MNGRAWSHESHSVFRLVQRPKATLGLACQGTSGYLALLCPPLTLESMAQARGGAEQVS